MKWKNWQRTVVGLTMSVVSFTLVLHQLTGQTRQANQKAALLRNENMQEANAEQRVSQEEKVIAQLQTVIKQTNSQTQTTQMEIKKVTLQIHQLNLNIASNHRQATSAVVHVPSTQNPPYVPSVHVPTLPPPPPVQSTTGAS